MMIRKLAFLPEKEIRLCLVGRTQDIRFVYESFLEEGIGVSSDDNLSMLF
jgi:hypothetical protein